jgi:uncharacterized membrane protein YkvA (DUF1232 family)
MRRDPYEDEIDDPEELDEEIEPRRGQAGRRPSRMLMDEVDDDETPRPRTGAKRTVMSAIRHLPDYLRLLLGLMRDRRVSRIDRLLVLGATAYLLTPVDFIPDFIPFFGQVDDIFLIVTALQRLVDKAGRRVLLDHWTGHPRELSSLNLAGVLASAGFFLPTRLRRRLRRMAR